MSAMSEMDRMIEERGRLTDALVACERGAWPGTPERRRESAAMQVLAQYDLAHPEVIVEIRARHRAERTMTLGEAVWGPGGCYEGGE